MASARNAGSVLLSVKTDSGRPVRCYGRSLAAFAIFKSQIAEGFRRGKRVWRKRPCDRPKWLFVVSGFHAGKACL